MFVIPIRCIPDLCCHAERISGFWRLGLEAVVNVLIAAAMVSLALRFGETALYLFEM